MRGKVARKIRQFIYGEELSYRAREYEGILTAQTAICISSNGTTPPRILGKASGPHAKAVKASDYASQVNPLMGEHVLLVPSVTMRANRLRRLYQLFKSTWPGFPTR